jgi:hypothetical protein
MGQLGRLRLLLRAAEGGLPADAAEVAELKAAIGVLSAWIRRGRR